MNEAKYSLNSHQDWLNKNSYYYSQIFKIYNFIIRKNSKILHIGCKNGLASTILNPNLYIGIDWDQQEIELAKQNYKNHKFYFGNLPNDFSSDFDFIILSDANEIDDLQAVLNSVKKFSNHKTRIIVDWYASLWEPALWLSQALGFKRPTKLKHWLNIEDVKNILNLSDFEIVNTRRNMLLPVYIPIISTFANKFLGNLPIINRLCLSNVIVARPIFVNTAEDKNVSVIITCKNERENVEAAILQCPLMGKSTEIIFVEGGSKDGTAEEIDRVIKKYPEKDIKFYKQDGRGKGDAVRKGFQKANGQILIILDGDLTTPAVELSRFYDALIKGKGEFINGSRLVYGMESEAMRFLNLLANYFFGKLFSWILGQRIKDTLCGTKVLYKSDYELIAQNRNYFGDFDPFGDFDLIFGAAKQNLKIVDLPVHYKNRTYGTTQIRRFYHGLLLIKVSLVALRKFKFL